MKIAISAEFEGKPACLLFVKSTNSGIFLRQRLQAAICGVNPEGDRVAFEDAALPWQQTEHGFATIKCGEPKKSS